MYLNFLGHFVWIVSLYYRNCEEINIIRVTLHDKWNLLHCKIDPHFFKDFIYLLIFRENGRERDREGETHQWVVASDVSPLGTWPATQACALTGNPTDNPSDHRPVLNPLSHTSQG